MYRAAVILTGVFLFVLSAAPSARAACPPPHSYPGDDAAKTSLALWMAAGASARGIPPELPVMAALVESGLSNLPYGDADSVGFFQMREQFWNRGEYAGYPDRPELQLEWFVDHAVIELERRGARGVATTELEFGEWIADVEKPATQYRYRYQLRLSEARTLIGPLCTNVVAAPPLTLAGSPVQRTRQRRAVSVKVGCGAEVCDIAARGTLKAFGRVSRISAPALNLVGGQKAVLRFPLGARLRRTVREALSRGAPVRVRIAVTAVDASAIAVTERWTARLQS
jgi:hypothetical protein